MLANFVQENHSLLLIPVLGKKARTFDLEAMFEQTRRTAVERSRKTLGKKFSYLVSYLCRYYIQFTQVCYQV